MKDKVITAQEFLIENKDEDFKLSKSGLNISDMMIEFAKLHVQEALNSAYIKIKTDAMKTFGSTVPDCWDDDSILNAYDLDNVK